MNIHKQSIFCLITLMMLLMVLQYHPSRALCEQEYEYYDYSTDSGAYRQITATINKMYIQPLAENDDSEHDGVFIVLYKYSSKCADLGLLEPYLVVEGPNNRVTLVFVTSSQAQNAVDYLSGLSDTVYAEIDHEVHAVGNTDEQSSSLSAGVSFHSYGANLMGFSEYLPMAQTYGHGSQTIAVIDSGVFLHAMIRPKIKEYGYDYVDADDDPTNDLYGHGTHVAGIIADCTTGAPVYILPIRVLDAGGKGKISNLVNALYEVAEYGVAYVNVSMTSDVESEALHDAIRYVTSRGSVVIVAAGNDARNVANVCPAHMSGSGIIVVGSAEGDAQNWSRASYSNYGNIDFYAFGSNISSCSRSGGYVTNTGTSMAAPHISAALALTALLHPDVSPVARLKQASVGGLPDLSKLVPESLGFRLSNVFLDMDDMMALPLVALPVSCSETIQWQSDNESIVAIENGNLIPRSVGQTTIRASCCGFEDSVIKVTVVDRQCRCLLLPSSVRTIEEGAFSNTDISHVALPGQIERIEASAFANCTDLMTITIPTSLSFLSDTAFANSDKMILLIPNGNGLLPQIENLGMQYIITQ